MEAEPAFGAEKKSLEQKEKLSQKHKQKMSPVNRERLGVYSH